MVDLLLINITNTTIKKYNLIFIFITSILRVQSDSFQHMYTKKGAHFMNVFANSVEMHEHANLILLFTLILAAGFFMTRITKVARLPHVSGYLLAGILIGPSVLGWVNIETVETLGVVTDIALAIIAFSVGRYFKLKTLKSNGSKVIILTLFESLMAGVFVTLGMHYFFGLEWPFCFLLGVIGSATAPASTVMTIRQYRAKGNFVDTVLQVAALDDAIALILFSIVTAALQAMNTGHVSAQTLIVPVVKNAASLVLGFAGAYLLKYLIAKRTSDDHRLVVLMFVILGLSGFCSALSISPLLSCMVLGAVYTNISDDKTVFRLLNFFAPPVLLTFFVVSGMRLDVMLLKTSGVIGVAYFFIRIAGKYLGAYLGAVSTDMEPNIKKYLGLALTPQAGVSIGLAALGQRFLHPEMASLLNTIILSSAVLYEITGPALAKASMILSGAIPKGAQKAASELGEA
jgi:Kef-type K+ transport system membrane component KefB